ncbi:MAG: DUF2384 domain-containing protein [Deltaproteobacteria bacterium]|nr:DUF2384 domain-containing protein [Deltaproteobacteria bacterium]
MKRQRNSAAAAVHESPARYVARRNPKLSHVDDALHDPDSGNLDAARIAVRLGIPLKRLAEAVGYTPQGLLRNPTSDRLQPALAEIAYILSRLRALLTDERSIAIWLRAPHPDLGGATPLSLMLSARAAAVIALLHLAESGQTS